ncbi:MAG: Crp/Fnr family transcriptional regulator [Dehalococcoidia bacterium]
MGDGLEAIVHEVVAFAGPFVVMFAPLIGTLVAIVGLILVDIARDRRRRRRREKYGEERTGPAAADVAYWVKACLSETDIFRGLTGEQLDRVVALGRWRTVERGARLGEAGEPGAEVYAILRGRLRLLSPRGSDELAVRLARTSETIPLAALMDPPLLVTGIEASDRTDVFAIPRDGLLDLCDQEPAIGLHVFRGVTATFERRYRSTLDGLLPALTRALELSRDPLVAGTPVEDRAAEQSGVAVAGSRAASVRV